MEKQEQSLQFLYKAADGQTGAWDKKSQAWRIQQ